MFPATTYNPSFL